MENNVRGTLDSIFDTMSNTAECGRRVSNAIYDTFGQNYTDQVNRDSRRNIVYENNRPYRSQIMDYPYPWADDDAPTMTNSFGIGQRLNQGYPGFYNPMYGKSGYNNGGYNGI